MTCIISGQLHLLQLCFHMNQLFFIFILPLGVSNETAKLIYSQNDQACWKKASHAKLHSYKWEIDWERVRQIAISYFSNVLSRARETGFPMKTASQTLLQSSWQEPIMIDHICDVTWTSWRHATVNVMSQHPRDIRDMISRDQGFGINYFFVRVHKMWWMLTDLHSWMSQCK